MLSRATIVLIISFLLGFFLTPLGASDTDLQGRLISAPPHYVRSKLFDADFVTALTEAAKRKDFFYPLKIREQAARSRNKVRPDAKYARDVNEAHVKFGSQVRVVTNSVSHVTIQEGSALRGQTLSHEFSFSERVGENGTTTIFEYVKIWRGAILLQTLQKSDILPQWIGNGMGERIDSLMVDGFVTAVERLWDLNNNGDDEHARHVTITRD